MDLLSFISEPNKEWMESANDFGKQDELGITDEKLETEFIRVFTEYFTLNGEYPTRDIFDEYSKWKYVVYRYRFQTSWSKICNMYGYRSRNNNKTELKVLKSISRILNTPFLPQPRWEWLKNSKGYKLRCDALYKEYNLVVEYDGLQHKEPVPYFGGEVMFNITRENDVEKNKLILEHGYKLLRIGHDEQWYDEVYLRKRLIDVGVILNG